ncbi:MAG: hypothetical protein RLP98_02405 [Devosia sp.]
MKETIIASAVTALLATSAIPAIAANSSLDLDAGAGISLDTEVLTAQTDAGVDAGVDASEDGVSVDAGVDAGAEVAGDMADDTYGSVMASVQTSADPDLSAVTEETDISIVLLSSLQGDAETESAALDEALIASADAQAGLHARISDNAAITAELEAEGYAVEDVISLKTKADGAVIVYVDDRA